MFEWFFGKDRVRELKEKTEGGFSAVKDDINAVGKWIKHLDKKDKQLFDVVFSIKEEIATIKDELGSLREAVDLAFERPRAGRNKQLFKKLPVLDKQTAVQAVQEAVQTPVQTGNFHGVMKGLSGNERLVVMTLMNSDMKLSYEDLALLLGKERSTVRGQVNSVKQKSEGLILEMVEKNGKKRVYVPEEIKEKMQKYASVRSTVKRGGKK